MTEEKKETKKEDDSGEYKLTDLPGVGAAAAAKLDAAGIYDMMNVAVLSPAELADMTGLGEAGARKAIQAARKMLKLEFSDGLEFAEKRKEVLGITTGSKNLDTLLGGRGIETRAITEAFGAYGSGKCVSKDTIVSYFNDTRMHVEAIENTYGKYKEKNGEEKNGEGFIIPVSTVKVLAWCDGELKIVNATNLYKEKVGKLFVVKTKRGRILKITGKHQFLGFDDGIHWKKTEMLKEGDLVACPKEINLETENIYDEDDAYFLGLFTAEGTHNPFSITISDEGIKDWICSYIERKFGYKPTVRKRVIDGRLPCYIIIFRNSTRVIMDGLDKCNAATKFIPEAIFLSSEGVISSFLGGYFDGDAEVSDQDISATTKSDKLASQLTYLLLRLGISASMRERFAGTKKEKFKVVRISGEDREKLKNIKMKLKNFDCPVRTSIYGYPRKIISFISDIYKESIGGNRGRLRKAIGKHNTQRTAYSNLINNSKAAVINTKTLDKIEDIFIYQRDSFISMLKNLENEEFSTDLLKEIYPKFPFAFSSLAENMGIKKKSMQNYYFRKIPQNKVALLKNLIINELRVRVDSICLALELISEIRMFNWDIIESIDIIDYNDFVYDFVVPEGHSFIGGNMPTMMHNSQLGFSLAVNVQLPVEKGGANGKAVYIDTEGTFRPERIRQIAESIGANPDRVLKNIFVARAFNSDHQILLMDRIAEMIKNKEPIKLIVIDSLTAHFRAEFAGRGQLADRQQKLNKYLHNLMKLAEQYNLAVYVTNQVMANPAMMFGDPTTAVGGNIVGHACLTGDSLIQLSDGSIVEIQDMKSNKIISSKFSEMTLEITDSEQTFINPNIDKIYNIKTNCQINCSGLHKFFTIDNFNIVEKEAKDLQEGDFIAQAKRIDIEGEDRIIANFKIKRIGNISKENAEIVKKKLEGKNIPRKEICKNIGITPRQFRRVLNQEYPTSFEVLNNLQDYFGGEQILQIIPFTSQKHRNIQIPEILNPKFAQIFGYFIGDGNFEDRGIRFKDERIGVLEYYNFLFKDIFNINCKIHKVKDKNCYSLNINSKEIRDLFEFMYPTILDEVGRSKKDVVAGFIKGFFDAEGHINKKRAYVSAVQKDAKVLRYLQLFLLRFGIRSTIKFDIGSKKINVLRIIDKDVKEYSQIGFTALDKQKRLIESINEIENKYSYEIMPTKRIDIRRLLEDCGLNFSRIIRSRPESYKLTSRKELENAFKILMNCDTKDRQIKQKIDFISKLLNGAIVFEKIKEINLSDNDGSVLYDFSVPKTENYIANGFIVHNSTYRLYFRRGKKSSRVAKLIDSPNLPDNETFFFIGNKGLIDEASEAEE